MIDPHALELVAEVGETPDRFAVGADDDVPRVPELRSTPRRPVRAAGCNRRVRVQSVRSQPRAHTIYRHSKGTVTSRYIHTIDSALVMAADTVAGYINGLLNGVLFKRTSYTLDRAAREATLARLFSQVDAKTNIDSLERIAA